ncbi:putative RNA-directed DNA polymerase [Helianthus annuus]|nr:putative RNA-directed DNA polymerase [Helianthus annuus]
MESLQSQEERINNKGLGKIERADEQALQVFQDTSRSPQGGSRGRGRGFGRGMGRGRTPERNRGPQCYLCNRFGHIKKDCWYNDEGHANIAENKAQEDDNATEEPHLFMMFIPTNQFALMADAGNNTRLNCLWFLDSGCSNHMTGNKDIFIQLDESFKLTVRLGDKKGLFVEGKGKVKIELDNGGYRLLDYVYYAPSLEYYLLSVGQLMRK